MAVTIKWNFEGFRQLRTDPAVMADLHRRAEAVAAAAGEGFEAKEPEVTGGRVRGRAAVVSMTRAAAKAEAEHHALLGALGAARG